MSDPKYPVIDPKDLIGDDDKPVIHKQKRMSEQELNAWSLLCALVVNRRKIDFNKLHEDMDWFRNIICGDDDDSE
jgi:hypothetical protein